MDGVKIRTRTLIPSAGVIDGARCGFGFRPVCGRHGNAKLDRSSECTLLRERRESAHRPILLLCVRTQQQQQQLLPRLAPPFTINTNRPRAARLAINTLLYIRTQPTSRERDQNYASMLQCAADLLVLSRTNTQRAPLSHAPERGGARSKSVRRFS